MLLIPPVVPDSTTSFAPAVPDGVTTVTEVALTLVSEVPATPPKVTKVVLPRLVPVIVTDVPPAVEPDAKPVAESTDVIVLVEAVMTSLAPSATAVVSFDVFTVKPAAAYVALVGLTIPAIVNVPVVFFARPHDAPASVTVTVVPVVEPVAVQLVKPAVSAIVGVAGIVNAALKTAVTVSPATKTLALLFAVAKLTVHVVWANATWDAPEKVTADTVACAGWADPNNIKPATAPASTKRRAWRKLELDLTSLSY